MIKSIKNTVTHTHTHTRGAHDSTGPHKTHETVLFMVLLPVNSASVNSVALARSSSRCHFSMSVTVSIDRPMSGDPHIHTESF